MRLLFFFKLIIFLKPSKFELNLKSLFLKWNRISQSPKKCFAAIGKTAKEKFEVRHKLFFFFLPRTRCQPGYCIIHIFMLRVDVSPQHPKYKQALR